VSSVPNEELSKGTGKPSNIHSGVAVDVNDNKSPLP